MSEKNLLVLARLAETPENAANAELLELTGIEPQTCVAAMADELPLLDAAGLARAIASSDAVLSL